MLLLKNCRLVPYLTEGTELSRADVLIKGEKIAAIRPVGHDFGPLPEAGVLDLGGKTLLPGFFDMHIHLCYYTYNAFEIAAREPGYMAFRTYEFAKECLDQGYTTLRDCGTVSNATVYVRDAINSGVVPGPRIISSGLIITPTETGNDSFPGLYAEADSPDELRRAVRTELQKGNDFIKYMASGAYLNAGGEPGRQIATETELRAVVEAAADRGAYVAAHAHGTEAIKAAIRAGVYTIEHGSFVDEEGIELLSRGECFMVPTGGIGLYCLDADNPNVSKEIYDKTLRYIDREQSSVNAACAAGLKLGFGSDLDMDAMRRETGVQFRSLREYFSFPVKDILLQATKNSAEICGLGDTVGTVKEGKLADLVVADGNPDEDINVLTRPLFHVIKSGALFR